MVLNVLQNDSNNNGVGLSVSELAHSVFGSFHKDTARFHEKKISQLMGAVCELAADNGIIVYAIKISTNKKTPEIKSRIVRWRIYDNNKIGCNEELIDALLSKKKCGEAHTKSFHRMLESAKQYGALNLDVSKKLELTMQ